MAVGFYIYCHALLEQPACIKYDCNLKVLTHLPITLKTVGSVQITESYWSACCKSVRVLCFGSTVTLINSTFCILKIYIQQCVDCIFQILQILYAVETCQKLEVKSSVLIIVGAEPAFTYLNHLQNFHVILGWLKSISGQ